MEELEIAYRYAPIIKFDVREPFFPVRIGYTIFNKSDESLSFPRTVEVPSGTTAIEYAIYWDWDIGHLYELEHVWVYVKSGKVTKVEASWHGGFNLMSDTEFESTHPILYSQPGKHAFASTPKAFEPRRIFAFPCGRKMAGIDGLLITRIFEGKIRKNPEDDSLVLSYLRKFSFSPAFEFTKEFKIEKDLLVPWQQLYCWIPERIKLWMSKLRKEKR